MGIFLAVLIALKFDLAATLTGSLPWYAALSKHWLPSLLIFGAIVAVYIRLVKRANKKTA